MGQYDVHPVGDGRTLVVDCQSDLLRDMRTRFVVPLLPERLFLPESPRLNPLFVIEDERFLLAPQGATSVPIRELRPAVASLWDDGDRILRAIDMLLSGV